MTNCVHCVLNPLLNVCVCVCGVVVCERHFNSQLCSVSLLISCIYCRDKAEFSSITRTHIVKCVMCGMLLCVYVKEMYL